MTNIAPGQLRTTVDMTKAVEGNWDIPRRAIQVNSGVVLHVIEKRDRTVFEQNQQWWIVFLDGEGPFWMRKHWFDNVTRLV